MLEACARYSTCSSKKHCPGTVLQKCHQQSVNATNKLITCSRVSSKTMSRLAFSREAIRIPHAKKKKKERKKKKRRKKERKKERQKNKKTKSLQGRAKIKKKQTFHLALSYMSVAVPLSCTAFITLGDQAFPWGCQWN